MSYGLQLRITLGTEDEAVAAERAQELHGAMDAAIYTLLDLNEGEVAEIVESETYTY